MSEVVIAGGPIFDGTGVRDGMAARFSNGVCLGLEPEGRAIDLDLQGDVLSPGYVDLQVNGGGGVMFNSAPTVDTLRQMARAHRGLGATTILPTLITDRPDVTRAAILAVQTALSAGVPGLAGLHLEGPHLSVARKGAHAAALIRPMDDADLALILKTAQTLPHLMVTLAPESVTCAQVTTLTDAGVIVALGHSDTDHNTAQRYFAAGARAVTHLYNAMSQLDKREPGLVGAALTSTAQVGLIADGIHVHPAAMALAWAAKGDQDGIFLVSDAMAPAGSDIDRVDLGGRPILRQGGKLTLADGTLAGADLDLTTALRVLVEQVGVTLAQALRAATVVPALVLGGPGAEWSLAGQPLDRFIRIKPDLSKATPIAE